MATLSPTTPAHGLELVAAGALLIDVRSEAGRAANGTVPAARVVAKDAVADFAATTPKDEQIVVFCGSTDGSGPFVDYLDEAGFTNVVHIDGGFAALKDAGIETTNPQPVAAEQA